MPLDAGDVLHNRYRVEDKIGEGGMGVVYRAWDRRLDKQVAIKELSPQVRFSDDEYRLLREQFSREAKVLAKLSHTHLVRVTDFFSVEDSGYLVMDYAEGTDLLEVIKREGPLPEEEVLTWARQLLDALAYCHSRGVCHRDIKPQNVIIDSDGKAMLVDFGLAKQSKTGQMLTSTALHGAGTPNYSPPEQLDPEGHTDQRSDIYSLGATLYHALTGQVPPSVTQRTAHPERLKPIESVVSTISSAAAQAVMKALELPVEARYQTAQDMIDALQASSPPVLAKDRPKRKRPRRSQSVRRPVWPWVMALVALGVAVSAAGWGVFNARTPSQPTATMIVLATETATEALPPTATQTPTSVPTPTVPTPSATPTQVATPTRVATYTPTLAPEQTATRSNTPTPISTPTATLTPTLAPTPTPAATSTSAQRTFAAPTLLAPGQNASFTGWNAEVILQWGSVGNLRADEWYVVRIPYDEAGNTAEFWRKETSFQVPSNYSLSSVGFDDRHYAWTVQVMRCTGRCDAVLDDNVRKGGQARSAPSVEGLFYWNPDVPGPKPDPQTTPPLWPTHTPPP